MLRELSVLAIAAAVTAAPAAAKTYTIDTAHSNVQFKVRHLGISTVVGNFNEFSGEIHYDPENVEATTASATIQIQSVDTNDAKRDNHLRSADFFDAENHPTMTFEGTKVSDVTKDGFKLHGDLTIRGITKPVVLDVETLGVIQDPWGSMRAGFSARTSVDRKDFNVNWNSVLDNGGLVVGNNVDIVLEIEAMVPKPAES